MLRLCFLILLTSSSIANSFFSQSLERFSKNGFFGYKSKKEIIVPPVYIDGPTTIYKYGVLQKNINDNEPNEGKLYGMIDNNGKIILPFEFEFIQKCQSTWKKEFWSLALVKKNNKFGFINIESGKIILPLIYDYIDFHGSIDEDPCKCFKEEYAVAKKINENKDTLLVLVNSYGNEIVLKDVVSIKNLNSHYKKQVFRLDYKNGDNTYLFFKDSFLLPKNMTYYYLDKKYKWNIFGSDNSNSLLEHLYNFVLLKNSENEIGLIDVKKRWIIEPKYDDIKIDFHKGYMLINAFKNGNSIPINSQSGNEIFDTLMYKNIKYLAMGVYTFQKNGKFGLINSENKLIKDAIYDNIKEINSEIIVEDNNKQGVINQFGEIILPLIYTKIEDVIYNAYVVNIDGKYGCIGKDGKVIVKIDYDYYVKSKNGFKRKEWGNSALVKVLPEGKSSFENNLDDPCYCIADQCVDCNECFGNGRIFKTYDIYCKYCKGKGIYFHDGIRKTCDICLGKTTEVKSSLCGKCNGCGKLKK